MIEWTSHMADVAQLVRASVCGTECRRFESGHPPHPSLPQAKPRLGALTRSKTECRGLWFDEGKAKDGQKCFMFIFYNLSISLKIFISDSQMIYKKDYTTTMLDIRHIQKNLCLGH